MRTDQTVTVYAGSAEDVVIPLLDDDGAPIGDLSGWSGRCQVKYRPVPTDPALAEWSTAAGTLILAGSAARLKVDAAMATASLGWTWRLAWFDLALTAPPGQGSLPQRPIRGVFRVIPGVSAAS